MLTMTTFAKTLVGTVATGALVMGSISPAFARDRWDDHDGISAGEIIAGALIIGGIAAIAASSDNDRYDRDYRYRDRYDRDYRGYSYRGDYRYGSPRRAVEQCIYAAERDAGRYAYGRARVTDIRDIDRINGGYKIKGRIAVNRMGRGWRDGDRYYGRGWDNDYRGWNNSYRGYDAGKFTCEVRYGRVDYLDIDDIRRY
jgi:hypothetical protein